MSSKKERKKKRKRKTKDNLEQSLSSSVLHWLLIFYHPTFRTAIVKPQLKKTKQRTTTNRKFLDKNVLKNYGSVSEAPVKRFYTNSLPTSKKTSAILFHQPTAPDTTLKLPFFALLTIWTLWTKWRQNLCSTFTGSFRHLWLSIVFYRLKTVIAICSTALRWFQSYVLDRSQCVVKSNSAPCFPPVFELAQYSVLGAVLFVKWVNKSKD